MGQSRPIFVYFCLFHMTQFNDKSVEGVLGTQTQGDRMKGADESTELWRHPFIINLFLTRPRPGTDSQGDSTRLLIRIRMRRHGQFAQRQLYDRDLHGQEDGLGLIP